MILIKAEGVHVVLNDSGGGTGLANVSAVGREVLDAEVIMKPPALDRGWNATECGVHGGGDDSGEVGGPGERVWHAEPTVTGHPAPDGVGTKKECGVQGAGVDSGGVGGVGQEVMHGGAAVGERPTVVGAGEEGRGDR